MNMEFKCKTCGYHEPDGTCLYCKHVDICNNYSAWISKESIKVGDEVTCDYMDDIKFIVTWTDGVGVIATSIDHKYMINNSIDRFTKTGTSYFDIYLNKGGYEYGI